MKVVYLCCLLITLGVVEMYGQKTKGEEYMQELMNECMRMQRNRAPDEFIHCEAKKKIESDDYREVTSRLGKRFFFANKKYKGKSYNVESFDFIPWKSMPAAVYTRWHPCDVPFSELKNEGSMLGYTGGDLVNRKPSVIETDEMILSKPLFKHLAHVKWSGEIVNGLIDGEGVGIACYGKDGDGWIFVKGKFKEGFPVGYHTMYFYTTASNKSLTSDWREDGSYSFSLSEFNDEHKAMLTNAQGEAIAVVDIMGYGRLIPEEEEKYWDRKALGILKRYYKTDEDFTKMERSKLEDMEKWYILSQPPYDPGYWVDRLPSKRFIGKEFITAWKELLEIEYDNIIKKGKSEYLSLPITNTKGLIAPPLFSRTSKSVYWRKGLTKMIEEKVAGVDEILVMMDVADGLYLTNPNQQKLYRDILYSRSPIFFIPSPFRILSRSNYWEVLNRSIEQAEKLKTLRPDLKSQLDAHIKTLHTWMDKSFAMYAEAEKWQAEQNKKDEEDWEAYKADMCDKCKIDGKQTVFPEGYAEKMDFLFLTVRPAQSAKDGQLVMVNGEKIKWKYVYYDDGSAVIETSGDYSDTFKSVEEMVTKIVERCKKKYCY